MNGSRSTTSRSDLAAYRWSRCLYVAAEGRWLNVPSLEHEDAAIQAQQNTNAVKEWLTNVDLMTPITGIGVS